MENCRSCFTTFHRELRRGNMVGSKISSWLFTVQIVSKIVAARARISWLSKTFAIHLAACASATLSATAMTCVAADPDLSAKAGLTAEITAEAASVYEAGRPVLSYQRAPKSQQGRFERAAYVHPLYDLDGNVLTEDFPADHLHHRGVF